MKYLETHSTDPSYNLAFEEWVLTHLSEGEYLILWQNDNAVIIGQNQNTPEEINPGFIREHGIRVVRRTTGGGAVYHDLGNLNYSFIRDYDREAGTDMLVFTDLVVTALKNLGLDACASGRNDILVDGKKVSGTAQRIVNVKTEEGSKERILYHGTLLFRSDPDMIAGALNADPLKFESKSTKSVRSRVGNIADYMPPDMGIREFWDAIKKCLGTGEGNGQDNAEQNRVDTDAVRRLKEEKYDTWEWNYGKSPKTEFRNRKRFAGGTVDIRLSIEKGIITEAAVYGDFLSLKPVSEIAEALKGCACNDASVKEILDRFTPADYFGTVTAEEVLQTILGR